MARYVILNAAKQIVNRCEWDGKATWTPPAGCTAMLEATAASKGYTDAPAPVVVPASVTRFQARAALLEAGILDAADAAAKAAGGRALLAWQDAQEFDRASPTLAALAAGLGLSDAQVDALFIQAAGITA